MAISKVGNDAVALHGGLGLGSGIAAAYLWHRGMKEQKLRDKLLKDTTLSPVEKELHDRLLRPRAYKAISGLYGAAALANLAAAKLHMR